MIATMMASTRLEGFSIALRHVHCWFEEPLRVEQGCEIDGNESEDYWDCDPNRVSRDY